LSEQLINIREIHDNKKQFLPLLLLADEQEDMIDRYLELGTMYVLEDGGVKAECVVTDEGGGILELKNLAVEPEAQRKGYGKALIDFLVRQYAGRYALLQVGTGDSRHGAVLCLQIWKQLFVQYGYFYSVFHRVSLLANSNSLCSRYKGFRKYTMSTSCTPASQMGWS